MIRTIAVLALGLAGCVPAVTGPGGERQVGHYSHGFEVDSFVPCGSEERWWVGGGADIQSRYNAIAPAPYRPVYVELVGRVGPEGRFGHMGAYLRELEVAEVIVMRQASDGDCR